MTQFGGGFLSLNDVVHKSTACKSKGLRCSGTGSSTLKIISAWPQAKGDMQ